MILPIEMEPPIRSYLHHAHALGVIAARRAGAALIQNQYINTAFRETSHEKLAEGWSGCLDFDPFCGFYNLPDLGYLETSFWDADWCCKADDTDVADRMLSSLRQGNYLEININEFFLLGSSPGLYRNLRHQTLVYGFEAGRGCFLCASYRKDRRYGATRIPFGLLKSAMVSLSDKSGSFYTKPVQVREIKVRSLPEDSVDRASIVRLLRDYAESRSSSPAGSYRPPAVFGLEANTFVASYLRGCTRRRSIVNPIATRFLWERQKLMLARMDAFAGFLGTADFNELRELWRQSLAAFHRIHLQGLEIGRRLRKQQGALPMEGPFSQACAADERATTETLRILSPLFP